MYCSNCKKETNNQKYCSRSCSTSANNHLHPKRKPVHFCETCKTPVSASRRWCVKCSQRGTSPIQYRRICDIQHKAKYQISAYIRLHARSVYKSSSRPTCCEHCGYNKHFEVCHKKAIKDFDATTLIMEINDPSNLIGLCPNCHWELDAGLLII